MSRLRLRRHVRRAPQASLSELTSAGVGRIKLDANTLAVKEEFRSTLIADRNVPWRLCEALVHVLDALPVGCHG